MKATRHGHTGRHRADSISEAVPINVKIGSQYKLPLVKRIESVRSDTPRQVLIAILRDCLKELRAKA